MKSRSVHLTLLLFIAAMIYISIMRWELIYASFLSFTTTILATLTKPSKFIEFWHVETADFWAAAIAWCAGLVGALFSIIKRRNIYPWKSDRSKLIVSLFSSEAKNTIGTLILFGFIFVGISAPIIAPVNPVYQGNLTTERLLPPFSHLTVNSFKFSFPPVNEWKDIDEVRMAANNFLLQRESDETSTAGIPDFTKQNRFVSSIRIHKNILSIFGTDGVGRDIFSRVVYGVRSSLAIGLIALFFSFTIGCSLGFIAGYFGGFVDNLITRFVDLILSIPPLFLVIALMAFLGTSLTMLILILAMTGWMGITRIVRGEVIHIRHREFVLAAQMLGVPSAAIIRKHLLPNVLPATLTAAILQLGNIILAEASLSFLGLGIQPPTPSWGNMIGDSMNYLSSAWWAGLFPGIALSLLLVSMHLLQRESLPQPKRGSERSEISLSAVE